MLALAVAYVSWRPPPKEMSVTRINEESVDIPEPEQTLPANPVDESSVDPGGDIPEAPRREPGLGEDPAYDPGGMGRQPDVSDDEETYP